MADAGGPEPAASPVPAAPQLFQLDPIDVVEGWQQELADSFHGLAALTHGRSQAETHDVLQRKASESMQSHNELVGGLVYGILTAAGAGDGAGYLRLLQIVSRDGFGCAVARVQQVAAAPRFGRVRGEVRGQVYWLAGELIRARAGGADQVVLALLRQLRGGDVAAGNIAGCRLMLRLLQEHYAWTAGFPAVAATAAYAFGRLALDHSRHPELRTQEAEFVVRLVRERFADCALVGRDLVRMLQDAAKLAPVRDLWHDLLHRPRAVSPQLAGVEQLLRVPTPRVFLASRLTYEMEARLLFILEQLPAGGCQRNTLLFVSRYLGSPEAESLVSDLVRYIVGVFHPSNALLASAVVPRYVLLGSLLRFVRSQVVAANAKLALFYDWLFYAPGTDSIMNIEPGVLIIARSVEKYTYLTTSFVEFLAFAADAYAPHLAPWIRRCVGAAMLDAVEKGVVPSLAPICNHPRLDPAVRRHMQQLFPQLVPPPADPAPGVDSGPGPDADLALDAGADLALDADLASDAVMDLDSIPPLDDDAAAAAAALPADTATTTLQPPSPPPAPPTAQPISQEELLDPVSRMFQDDAAGEGDAESASDTESNAALLALADDDDYAAVTLERALADTSVWLFGPALSEFAANMSSPEPDVEQAARAVREIVDVFAQSDAAVAAVARVLALVFTDALEPEDIETTAALAAAGEPADSLERDLLHRLFAAAMPHLKNPAADGASRVLQLLVRLTAASADVGFRWLVYCVADAGAPQHYARYVEHHAAGSVRAALARDLAALQERFPGLFYTLLPRVYAAFPREFAGTAGIVRAVVALIDQPQVYRLNALVARGHLRLFGTAPAASAIAAASIDECGVFEQVCLWQLLHAELAGSAAAVAELAEHLLLRCALDPASNSEAATGLLALLRTVPPAAALLQTLAAYAADPLPATVDDPYTRADLCGSALTAWLRAAKPALLALIPDALLTESADDGPVRRMLVQWTATFAGGFGSTASDRDRLCDEIARACLPPAPPPPPPPVPAPAPAPVPVPALVPPPPASPPTATNGGTRPAAKSDTVERKRRASEPRPKPRTTRRSAAKRRRRNVDTSDEDSGSNSSSNSGSSSGSSSDSPRIVVTRSRRRRRGSSSGDSDQSSGLPSSPILSSESSSLASESDSS